MNSAQQARLNWMIIRMAPHATVSRTVMGNGKVFVYLSNGNVIGIDAEGNVFHPASNLPVAA
jgi:hypothetical protein